MEAMLCTSCRKTLNRSHFWGETNRWYYPSHSRKSRYNHSDFRSFHDAVVKGCFICCLLWTNQQHLTINSREDMVSFRSSLELHQFRYKRLYHRAEGNKCDTATGDYSFLAGFVHIPFEPLGSPGNKDSGPLSNALKCQIKRLARPLGYHSDQQPPIEICDTISSGLHLHGQRWIRECLDNHKSCQQNQAEMRWVPERLIKVQEKGEMEHYELRLITNLALPAKERYTTLSHRWSSQSFLKLTRNNFQRLSRGFLSSDLPQTFRDAVSATYHLGFHYLWIDSLCIIQDDLDDWSRQSAQMHQIYASAVCNLAASWAEDCTKPMFSQRLDSSQLANTIKIRDGMRHKKMKLVDKNIWRRGIEDSPLRKRGWIYQERFLSPRIMHFCEDQVLWECKELNASENWHLGFWSIDKTYNWSDPDLLVPYPPGLKLSQDRRTSFENWGGIMKTYSSTCLTKDTDRLIALSGVASAFAASRGFEASAYIAGMWRDTLELSLFWMVDGPAEEWKHLRHYIAPSFSWTSTCRKIQFAWESAKHIDVPIPYFRASVVHLRYGSVNKFGNLLEDSHLIVIGPVWTVRWVSYVEGVEYLRPSRLRIGKTREMWAHIHFDHPTWFTFNKDFNEDFNEDLFCISGGEHNDETQSESTSSSKSWTPTILILLRPMPKHGIGAYRRIGLAIRMWVNRYDCISLTPSDGDASGISSVDYRPDTGEHVIKIF